MSVVITHPTGNEFFRAAAHGFYNAGELQSIYTCIASFQNSLLYKLGSYKPFQDIRRRELNEAFKSVTHIYPWKEIARLIAIKTNQKKWLAHETGMFSVDQVYQSFDKHVSAKLATENEKGATAIYAYEDGAAYSFQKAKALGMQTVYDLPIGYWRSMQDLLALEKEKNPEWANTLDGLKNSAAKLARKDQEIALSDAIIVASSFTAETLKTYPHTLPSVYVVPYGFPPALEKIYRRISANDKIKLLFVGGLSQRKGLSYLFEAVEKFKNKVSLTIVGRRATGESKILNKKLSEHTWFESLPHQKVLSLMRDHDVLIFPSLFEGFGQVITEAMAQGIPVITTERTAGPDIIRHNENGWLVKAGCTGSLASVLNRIIENVDIIEATGQEALYTAKKRPWELYGKDLSKLLCS